MTAMIFDTHNFVKGLTAPGMPLGQAEVLANEQARLIRNRLSTKDDMDRSRLQLRADNAVLNWMTGFVVAGCLSLILKNFF